MRREERKRPRREGHILSRTPCANMFRFERDPIFMLELRFKSYRAV